MGESREWIGAQTSLRSHPGGMRRTSRREEGTLAGGKARPGGPPAAAGESGIAFISFGHCCPRPGGGARNNPPDEMNTRHERARFSARSFSRISASVRDGSQP